MQYRLADAIDFLEKGALFQRAHLRYCCNCGLGCLLQTHGKLRMADKGHEAEKIPYVPKKGKEMSSKTRFLFA